VVENRHKELKEIGSHNKFKGEIRIPENVSCPVF
jgi:hypothetical protein